MREGRTCRVRPSLCNTLDMSANRKPARPEPGSVLREEPAVWDARADELSEEELDALFEAALMTPEEAEAAFDADARLWLNMSGEEFRRAWEAGELDVDGPDHGRIIRVWFSMPGAGPVRIPVR